MDNQQIAISQFADNCQIPRPTMSQILNGRNKKISDELISKIHAAYPELSILWLMFGEGEMKQDSNIKFSSGQISLENSEISNQKTDIQQFYTDQEETMRSPELSSKKFFSEKSIENSHSNQADENFPSSDETSHTKNPDVNYLINFDILSDQNSTFIPTTLKSHSAIETDIENRQNPKVINNKNITNDGKDSPTANINRQEPSEKYITNIVVFYSDNSFQSFYPGNIPQTKS